MKQVNLFRQAAVAALLVACNLGATAADDAVTQLSNLKAIGDGIGGSPAATVLGIGADKIERPSNIQKLSMSLLQGLKSTGDTATGFAVDFTPATFDTSLRGGVSYAKDEKDESKVSDFSQGWGTRLWVRTNLSLGAANASPPSSTASSASGSTTGVKYAWGARVGIIDNGDLGLHWRGVDDCGKKVLRKVMPVTNSASAPEGSKADAASLQAGEQCIKDLNLWGKFSLYAGFGESWYLDKASVASIPNAASDVKLIWMTMSKGLFVKTGRLHTVVQAYLERRLDDRAPSDVDPNTLVRQDSTQGIVRLRTGDDSWHAYGEWGRTRIHLGDATKENTRHVALGAEFSAKGFLSLGAPDSDTQNWFQVALVSERGYLNGKVNNGVTFGYKYGMPFLLPN